MGSFIIEGGHKLKGEIQPQGAKNEALQILCAVLLTPEKVIINNVPDIVDINILIELLKDLGVKVEKLNKDRSKGGRSNRVSFAKVFYVFTADSFQNAIDEWLNFF